ncbi:MAG TPA: M64 family metallopeptidase, partial [Bacteroidia bacterium]|nr:M64 family metallopeptidase [Bacteroidia bacterium]
MKRLHSQWLLPLVLAIALWQVTAREVSAQTFQVDTIWYSGSPDKYINLVFMGDGFQASEFATYALNVQSFTNYLFTTSPFMEYQKYFNVFAINVPSTESGADHPRTASDCPSATSQPVLFVNTYFNSTFDYGSIHRLLVPTNGSAINTVLLNNFPQYDQKLVLVNTPYYGGSGGSTATASLHSSSYEIMIHEMGHSFAGLADEYYAGDGYAGEKPNMSQETNPLLVRWKNWIGYGGVGIYQHCCGGNSALWYRPHNNCKMRYLGSPFCPVCKENIIEKIHSAIGTPVISSLPAASEINFCSHPVQFSINTVKPVPNTLRVRWILNGTEISTNVDSVIISAGQIHANVNTLSAEVVDTTALTRADSHLQNHVYTVDWTINYNPLLLTISQTSGSCNGNDGSATVNATGGVTTTTFSMLDDLESSNTWTLVNGTQTNKWFVGTAAPNGGTQSIYISNNNSANAYTLNSTSTVHFYKDFTFPAGATNISIRFDWKGYGENLNDYLRVFLIPTITIPNSPSAGTELSSGQIGSTYNLQSNFITTTITGLDANAGTTKRLVFSWRNNNNGGTQPPAAIDNIVVSYSVPAGYTYLWSNTQSSATATGLSGGTYTVTVTDAIGCTATASVTINQSSSLSAVVTASGPLTFCQGDAVTLTSSAANSYYWNNAATTQSITVTSSGNYFVTITDVNGCSATSSVTTVTVNSPVAVITANGAATFCQGGSVTLTSSPASSYNWNTGATTQSITVNSSGNYYVTVTDAYGCSANSSATTVTVNPLPPVPTITSGGATTFCQGNSVTLTSSAASSYYWSNGATTQNITVTSSGNYSVTISNAYGCLASSSATAITVNPLPTATITPDGATTFCQGGFVTLTSSAASSYNWSTGATTQSITVTSSGNYYVTVTDAYGCSATSSAATVTVNPQPPVPTITSGGATTFCQGNSVTLTS